MVTTEVYVGIMCACLVMAMLDNLLAMAATFCQFTVLGLCSTMVNMLSEILKR
jgi:hypothetical protein